MDGVTIAEAVTEVVEMVDVESMVAIVALGLVSFGLDNSSKSILLARLMAMLFFSLLEHFFSIILLLAFFAAVTTGDGVMVWKKTLR